MRDVVEILGAAGMADAVVVPLNGGYSNETYRVTQGSVEAVLRINGRQNDTLGLSRVEEAAAIRVAAERGVGPRVIAAGEDHLLTELVPGELLTPEESHEPRYIREMARALREVHSIDGVDRRCDPFWLVRTYLEGARRLGYPMPDGLDGVLREVDAIEARAAARGDGEAYCHNDFYRFNVIADDGRLTLLDWELSGIGNVYFDLATPAFHEGYTPDEDRLLIEAYFGEYDERHAAALHDFKYLNMVREVAWATLHAAIDTARPDAAAHVNHTLDYQGEAAWFLGRILAGHVTARDA